ncbi:MAG TPA: hypothetical protein VKB69_12150 [Micromonosporaceae bacterium]|nr:hypothetical protein [Micromonosporaceae bacterium]
MVIFGTERPSYGQVGTSPSPSTSAMSRYPLAISRRSATWSSVELKSPASSRTVPPGVARGSWARLCHHGVSRSGWIGAIECTAYTCTGIAPGTCTVAYDWCQPRGSACRPVSVNG